MKIVVAGVSFVATVAGLVFLFVPSLQPEPPPPTKGVEISRVTLERVSFGQYLQRIRQTAEAYEEADLRRRGVLVEFNYAMQGYKGRRLPVLWQLVAESSGDIVDESDAYSIEPLANDDRGSWSVWIPMPRDEGRYHVKLQLLNDKGIVPLDRQQTDTFTV